MSNEHKVTFLQYTKLQSCKRPITCAPRRGEHGGGTTPTDPLFRARLGVPAPPAPDDLVVMIGVNSLACRMAPHAVVHDVAKVIKQVSEAVRRTVGGLALYGATEATVVILTCIPWHQLSLDALAAFRGLSDTLRGVARSPLRPSGRRAAPEGGGDGEWQLALPPQRRG